MISILGVTICIVLYPLIMFLLGPILTAGVLIIHCVVVPLLFKYSKLFRRTIVFGNCVQWPRNVDFEEPSTLGIVGVRNISIEFQSKVDRCHIKIGVWHLLPKSIYERTKEMFTANVDKERLSKMMDQELAKSGKPIMLYCHGNANSRAEQHRLELYKFLQNLDYHVVCFDYRGYGDSSRVTPTEDGVVEDTLVVYEWLHNTVGGNPPVFVWGHSLGTAISSHLLGNLKDLCHKILDRDTPLPLPKGLILEAPFNNLQDEVGEHPFAILVSWLPYHDWTFVEPFRNCPEHEFRTDQHLLQVPSLPIIILHAKDDFVILFRISHRLYKYLLKYRLENDAEVKFYGFESNLRLGHKWICRAKNLNTIVDDFVKKYI